MMSLSALIYEQLMPIQRWTAEILDTILLQGDSMYRLHCHQRSSLILSCLCPPHNRERVPGFPQRTPRVFV